MQEELNKIKNTPSKIEILYDNYSLFSSEIVGKRLNSDLDKSKDRLLGNVCNAVMVLKAV
jgi:hypothetical protein